MLGELGITHSKVWPAAVEGFRNKHINIQIGVNTLSRRNPSELWVEFDPTNEALATPNRLVLPFIVTAELSDRGHAVQPFFVKHALSACSSTLLSAGAWTRANSSSHAEVASQACRSLASNVSPNVSTPLWPWGDDYRAMIASRSRTHATAGGKHGHEPWRGACFICQDADASSLRRVEFPALGLGYFLTELRPAQVDSLIIDAQGLDFRIIRSLKPSLLRQISRIVLECQSERLWPADAPAPVWLYREVDGTAAENSCEAAQRYLENQGFVWEQTHLNNCKCLEFNLVMRRTHPPNLPG